MDATVHVMTSFGPDDAHHRGSGTQFGRALGEDTSSSRMSRSASTARSACPHIGLFARIAAEECVPSRSLSRRLRPRDTRSRNLDALIDQPLRASCGRLTGVTDRSSVAWAADTWRVPAWLWIGVAAMTLGCCTSCSTWEWGYSTWTAGSRRGRLGTDRDRPDTRLVGPVVCCRYKGRGGGILSAAVLALGWTTMMNGYPIVSACRRACRVPRCPTLPTSAASFSGRSLRWLRSGRCGVLARRWAGCCRSVQCSWSSRCSRRSAARLSTRSVGGPA